MNQQIYKRLKTLSQNELCPTVLQLSRKNLVEFVTPKTIVRPYSFSPRYILFQTYAVEVSSLTFKDQKLQNSFSYKTVSSPSNELLWGYFETTIYGNEIFVVTKGNVTPSERFRVEKSYPVYQLRTLVTELIFNSIPISAIEFVVEGKSAFYPLALLAAHEIYDFQMNENGKVYETVEDEEVDLVKLQITSSSTAEVFWVQDTNQNKLGLLYLPSMASLKFVKGLFTENTRKIWCMCRSVELDGETRYVPIQVCEDDSDNSSWSSDSSNPRVI